MHQSITPPFQSLRLSNARMLNGLIFSNGSNRWNLFLRLPTSAKGSVQLHHTVELRATRARKVQLGSKKVLVSDQNFKIIGQSGVIAQARESRGVFQRVNLRFLLDPQLPQLFNCYERVRHLPETGLRRLLVLRKRLVKARNGPLIVPEQSPALKNRLQ